MIAAVVGATGYTGMLLLRLLDDHPGVKEILPVSSSKPGEALEAEDPGIFSASPKFLSTGGRFISVEEAVKRKPDVVFAALPHLASAVVCEPFFGKTVVIDLSADFRIHDHTIFEKAYGQLPPRPDLLAQSVYGLSEWHTQAIKGADIIANPGCYPTCSLTPLLPLLKRNWVEGKIIVNALSGISGAGKKASVNNLFVERAENSGPYNPGRLHRHSEEIQVELDKVKSGHKVLFNPHLIPLKRGMVSTITLDLKKNLDKSDILKAWNEDYSGRPFVRIQEKRLPQCGDVWGSNRCDIGLHQEENTLILFSVIDNLMKGASGQAVQNMNLRFGFPETAGLPVNNQV